MASNLGFRQRLAARQTAVNSVLCVGLDPLPDKLPRCLHTFPSLEASDISEWIENIVDATAPFVSLFKPQRAHWEALAGGADALRHVIRHIKIRHSDISVLLDCKRGDIGRTQQRYRVAHFDIDGADGVNFSPYMGKDCMEGLVDKDHPGRALVGLCYTSNPAARQVQDVKLADGRCYWEFMAQTVMEWAEELGVAADAGLVMAAAYEQPAGSGQIYCDHLTRCREIVGDKLWFLIPGIGTQGGFIAETVRASYTGCGSIAINSSSEIIFASDGDDYAAAAARKAEEARDAIRAAMS